MSRSDPPRSSIAERLRQNRALDGEPNPSGGRSSRRALGLRFAALVRWLHIYLSMFGLAAVLFFSVTGLTLNHPDWFLKGAESIDHAEGRVNPDWLHLKAPAAGPETETNSDQQVDRLSIVEHLRAQHDVRGALVDFSVDDYECMVTFKGPGYAADAFIDRDTGRYQLTETSHGAVAVLNDLHKGRDTGESWSLLIDISAVLLTVISLSGLILILYLKLRRVPGLVLAFVGTATVVAIILLLVP